MRSRSSSFPALLFDDIERISAPNSCCHCSFAALLSGRSLFPSRGITGILSDKKNCIHSFSRVVSAGLPSSNKRARSMRPADWRVRSTRFFPRSKAILPETPLAERSVESSCSRRARHRSGCSGTNSTGEIHSRMPSAAFLRANSLKRGAIFAGIACIFRFYFLRCCAMYAEMRNRSSGIRFAAPSFFYGENSDVFF